MPRALTFVAILLISASTEALSAQSLVLGGGLNVGTIPRALEPLCGSARRLRGVGVVGRAGVGAGRFQVDATLDYVTRLARDAAECIARSGRSVDSSFAPATNSAGSVGITGWVSLNRMLRTGLEAGRVIDRSSWFVGPAVGVQARNVRLGIAARSYVVSFDEVTREYGSGTTRELARRSDSERSWGAIARLLLLRL